MSGRVVCLVVSAAPPASRIGELVAMLRPKWTVCVVATPRAAGWLDAGQVAELSGFPVRHDFQSDASDGLPEADVVALVPGTFNTINKWAAGISDTFALGILNEAIGLSVPVIAVPHAKATLAAHPAFGASLEALRRWGVRVLRNEILRREPLTSGDPAGFDWSPVVEVIGRS